MNKNPNKITEMPYAKWLEENLSALASLPIRSICIAAITDTGEPYADYYNTSTTDLFIYSGIINQDATLNTLEANGYIECVDDLEEEDGIDGEEKE